MTVKMEVEKICFVGVDVSLMLLGLRRLAPFVLKCFPNAQILIINSGELRSDEDWDLAAQWISKNDVACFSSITPEATVTKKLIAKAQSLNPSLYSILGGVHSISYPDDAIKHADAICTGEGEIAFPKLLNALKRGLPFQHLENFWFRNGDEIIKNELLPLVSGEQFSTFPYPMFMDGEQIFLSGKGFVNYDPTQFILKQGLLYPTIWAIGCPLHCTYCGNTKFIENDPDYRKIRYRPPKYMVAEVKHAIEKFPFISSIIFEDDSLLSIPLKDLEEFANLWEEEINLPFHVVGIIPSYVNEQKLRVLIRAGMVKVRMGIQSGSDKILKFYQRPNNGEVLRKAISILGKFTPYMLPPYYDIIIDNPIETQEDIILTLELLNNMERPYLLNITPLVDIPGTVLSKDLKELNISIPSVDEPCARKTTFAHVLLYLIALTPIPQSLFLFLSKYVQPGTVEQPSYPRLFSVLYWLYEYKLVISQLIHLEFSRMSGRKAMIFSRLGFQKITRKWLLWRCSKVGLTPKT